MYCGFLSLLSWVVRQAPGIRVLSAARRFRSAQAAPPREPRRNLHLRTADASIDVDASLSLGAAGRIRSHRRGAIASASDLQTSRTSTSAAADASSDAEPNRYHRAPTVLARPGRNRANFRRELIRRHFLLSRPIRSPNVRACAPIDAAAVSVAPVTEPWEVILIATSKTPCRSRACRTSSANIS
jgi:hypothetical protein